VDLGLAVLAAGLEQATRTSGSSLRRAGEHAARRAGADDHVVVDSFGIPGAYRAHSTRITTFITSVGLLDREAIASGACSRETRG
jgi:hypothetical protein